MADVTSIEAIAERDRATFGDKAWRLARMIQAGLPVPAGFCIGPSALEPIDRAVILSAYHAIGGVVAVRSSSASEDAISVSFAGQFDSVLNVQGDEPLLAAIETCLQSRHSRRARAYRRGLIAVDDGSMAVIVQQYVPVEQSGVLFTRHPDADNAMLLEATTGSSHAVEAGLCVPMQVRIDRKTGASEAESGDVLPAGFPLKQLHRLAMQIESLFAAPCDIEWGIAAGEIAIFQARPISTPSVAERETYRRAEIETATVAARGRKTAWIQDNLAEILPAPTPMTWSLLQQLLSASGGFGMMYRDLGVVPDRELGTNGIYDLIAGRPFLNLNRSSQMQFGDLPLGYSYEQIQAAPQSSLARQPVWLNGRTTLGTWLRLPRMLWQLRQRGRTLNRQLTEFPAQFESRILPAYDRLFEIEGDAYSVERSDEELLSWLRTWCDHVFVQFGRYFFRPAALADFALAQLRAALPKEDSEARIAEVLSAARISPEVDVARALAQLAAEQLSDSEFRERFGHRADGEMELAVPRYSEFDGPVVRAQREQRDSERENQRSMTDLPAGARVWAARLLELSALRELAKHHFLRGYAVMRRILLELDRRLSLGGGIFFLTAAELEDRSARKAAHQAIAERRRRWAALRSMPMPNVLFSEQLDRIGRPPDAQENGQVLSGLPLSAGIAEGPALVLSEPDDRTPSGAYVLVCPQCDTAWTPMLLNARAAVFETGGMLSHGAIVAREFGVPAVGGISQATQRIRSGQVIRVDGSTGRVTWPPSPAARRQVRDEHSGRG